METRWGCKPPRRRDRRKWSPGEASEVYGMFRAGLDTYAIAEHLGMHESEVVRGIDAHREYSRSLADGMRRAG